MEWASCDAESASEETSRDMSAGYDHDEGSDYDAACDRHDVVSGYGVDCDRETGCSGRRREDRNRHGESSGRSEERNDAHVRGRDNDGHCSGGFRRGEKLGVIESGADRGSRNAVNACDHAFLHGACGLPRMPSLLESRDSGVSSRAST